MCLLSAETYAVITMNNISTLLTRKLQFGALFGSKRDLATGFGVLFDGMGVLPRRAGAISTRIIILFAAVGVY